MFGHPVYIFRKDSAEKYPYLSAFGSDDRSSLTRNPAC